MAVRGFRNQEEKTMPATKNVSKATPAKPAVTSVTAGVARAKAAPGTKPAKKPEPVAKARVAPKAATKAAAKAAPKATAAKPVRSRAKKPAGVLPEQRRNYVEVAAYHIAERRGFAPGDPWDDWVQAEAEIDRLIADGLLGG
jgi:hypothetical protein